jgi:hypothetical protein
MLLLALVTTPAFGEEPIKLICEFKGLGAAQRVERNVLEIDLEKLTIKEVVFVNGQPDGQTISYKIAHINEYAIVGEARQDIPAALGRVTHEISINRVTSEIQYRAFWWGVSRNVILNPETNQRGGFNYEPVITRPPGLQCRKATRQF